MAILPVGTVGRGEKISIPTVGVTLLGLFYTDTASGCHYPSGDMEDVGRLIARLDSSSKVTEERVVAKEAAQLLDTESFCAALSSRSAGDGSNGFTLLLKRLCVKWQDAKASTEADFLFVMNRLVSQAARWGAQLDGRTACNILSCLASTLEADLNEEHPRMSTTLHWSLLVSLASEPSHFLAVGREPAQKQCAVLTNIAWTALLPSGASADRRQTHCTSAARLLKGLLLQFPYALDDATLKFLLEKLKILARVSTPASARTGAGAAGVSSLDDDDVMVDAARQLRPRLHDLWAAANGVLRRQGADCAEVLWHPGTGFANCKAVQDWIVHAFAYEDHQELLLQLVQLCRLLQRLSSLVRTPLPSAIDGAASSYISREIYHAPLLLSNGCVPTLLRLPPPDACSTSVSTNYKPLVFLDFAAEHMLRAEGSHGPAASAETLEADAETSVAGRVKRARIPSRQHQTLPSWLSDLLALDAPSGDSRHTQPEPSTIPAIAAKTATWVRKLLIFAAIIHRRPEELGVEASQAAVAALIPFVKRGSEWDPEVQLCALNALLALAPVVKSSTSNVVIDPQKKRTWDGVWAAVWACERVHWTEEPPTISANHTILMSELRQRLLSQLMDSLVLDSALLSTAIEESSPGCAAAASSFSIARAGLASRLLSSPCRTRSTHTTDFLVGNSALASICCSNEPFDQSQGALCDAALMLHPGYYTGMIQQGIISRRALTRWIEAKRHLALAAAGYTGEFKLHKPCPISPLAIAAAAAATIPHDVRSLSRVEEPTSLPGQSMSGQLEFPSYLSEVIQGGLIDAETVTILQVEAELLQLQAAYKQVGNRATTPELHLLSNAAT